MKSAAIGAVVAILVLMATNAIAGNGIGAVFNLGETNGVNKTSLLAGDPGGEAPELAIANTGTGPPLALFSTAGQAPFTVNSSTTVSGLSANFLSGLSAASFVQGRGRYRQDRASIDTPALDTTYTTTLLELPGFFRLRGTCRHQSGASAHWKQGIEYTNLASGHIDVAETILRNLELPLVGDIPTSNGGGAVFVFDETAAYSFQFAQAFGAFQRLVTVEVRAVTHIQGQPIGPACFFNTTSWGNV
jgi:hypothetical protein